MNEIKCSNAQVVPPAVSDIIKNKGDNECKIRTIYSTITMYKMYILYIYSSNSFSYKNNYICKSWVG